MSTRRVIKKTVYAIGYGTALTLFLVLIFSPFINRDTVIEATPTPQPFASIEIEEVVVLPYMRGASVEDKVVDIVVRMRNPNPRAGIVSYPLTFRILDEEGEEIRTIQEDAYILPGGLQYVPVVNVSIPFNRQLGRVEVVRPQDVRFIPVPEGIELPNFNTSLLERTSREIGGEQIQEQVGIVTNNSTFDWQRVEVRAVALSADNRVIGTGKTFVGRLLTGEQREFVIQWPEPQESVHRVIAFPATNIFRDDNFVDVIGDPSLLR